MLRRRHHVHTYDSATGLTEAHRRFGGFDLPAATAGMLAGVGTGVILAGLAAAVGDVGYQRDTGNADLTTGAVVTGLAVLLVAFLVGGWVAGRMARYDGVLNGALSGVLFIAVVAGISALGRWLDDKYDFLGSVHLPQWFSGPGDWTRAGWAAVGILVVCLAAALGGAIGSSYHRRADRVIAVEPGLATMSDALTTDDELTEDQIRGEADVEMQSSDRTSRRARH